ncbi:Hint domain-containing protein [Palleronia sp.]|uniref:Hint domain-containing protein n=1 Tax=Palleronia sp. TaxID=1940284 RepID=UPI0035C83085
MAVYTFAGFSTSDIRFISGSSWQVDPTWDVDSDALVFEVWDDDSTFGGDDNADEVGADSSQYVVVRDANGSVVAQGQGYLEQAFTYTDEYGHAHPAYVIEIGGTPVGVVVDGPVQPGNNYTISTISNVGSGSYAPAYSTIDSQTYDPDDANAIKGTSSSDTLLGGAGDDTIIYGNGDDSVSGGDGNDVIDDTVDERGIGQNTLDGGAGNDTIYGSDGASTIHGGSGDDSLMAEGGNDYVDGGSGHDYIVAELGNDTVFGGSGNDTILGGSGDDVIVGGDGNDTFRYGAGSGNDTVADFGTDDSGALNDGDRTNNDFIDLSNYYDSMSELRADFDDDGVLNQSSLFDQRGRQTDYSDNTSFGSGSITMTNATSSTFTKGNTGVTCFTSGTPVLTPRGVVPIDDLRPGDLVCTRDDGPQPLAWIGRSVVGQPALLREPRLRPIRLSAGYWGLDRDLLVSRQHGILLGDELVRAAYLLDQPGARVANGKSRVCYIHLLFERHQIIVAGGIESESFYPGPQALTALNARAFDEVSTLLPEVVQIAGGAAAREHYGPPARAFPTRRELRLRMAS